MNETISIVQVVLQYQNKGHARRVKLIEHLTISAIHNHKVLAVIADITRTKLIPHPGHSLVICTQDLPCYQDKNPQYVEETGVILLLDGNLSSNDMVQAFLLDDHAFVIPVASSLVPTELKPGFDLLQSYSMESLALTYTSFYAKRENIKMDWIDAWHITGETLDYLLEWDDIDTRAQQHENIANIIMKRSKQTWDDHNQEWKDNDETT